MQNQCFIGLCGLLVGIPKTSDLVDLTNKAGKMVDCEPETDAVPCQSSLPLFLIVCSLKAPKKKPDRPVSATLGAAYLLWATVGPTLSHDSYLQVLMFRFRGDQFCWCLSPV